MQQVILAVGRIKSGAESELLAHYTKQIRPALIIHELADAPTSLASAARKAKEAEAFAKQIPAGAFVVALDARGKELSSEQLSALIGKQELAGTKQICWLIGGQDGLDETLVTRADACIAFGKMIWPHKLARIMLAEQLFRAQCIARNHPYHSGHA